MKKVCMIFIVVVIVVTAGCKQKESKPAAEGEAVKMISAVLRKDKSPEKFSKAENVYLVPLSAETPKGALRLISGRVQKIVSSNGESLLCPEDKFRWISFEMLKEGDKNMQLEILTVSPQEGEFIKEISGTLEYWSSEQIERIDTGLVEFADGMTIKGTNGTIKSVRTDREGKKVMMLELDPPLAAIRGVEFYSENQVKLKATQIGSGGLEDIKVRPIFLFEDPLPAKGRMFLRLAKDTKKEKIDFKAVNISVR